MQRVERRLPFVMAAIFVALPVGIALPSLLKRPNPSDVGRYQLIQFGNGNGPAFILDTASGMVLDKFADYNKQQEQLKKQTFPLTTAQ
ncbi:MAG: hypothetical protein V4719_12490 [Planctomycetota bacterium]